jgi:hypothetical protein
MEATSVPIKRQMVALFSNGKNTWIHFWEPNRTLFPVFLSFLWDRGISTFFLSPPHSSSYCSVLFRALYSSTLTGQEIGGRRYWSKRNALHQYHKSQVCVPQSMCPKNWTSQCHPSWESSGIFLRLLLHLSWTLRIFFLLTMIAL